MKREEEGLTALGRKTEYKSDYAPEVLETFENKHPENDYWVKFNCPEFTSLCPITGQPDFAEIIISDLPDRRMREHGRRHGYTFDHRARQFHASADFDRFDLILTMDDANFVEITGQALTDEERAKVVPLARFLRHHPQAHDIPDPYYGGDAGFERVIALLEDACEGLLASFLGEK